MKKFLLMTIVLVLVLGGAYVGYQKLSESYSPETSVESEGQAEMPDFEEAYQKYGEEIQFLMVNQTDGSRDTVESAAAFIKDAGYSFPIYFDTTLKAAVAYHVTSIPRTVFINADGSKLAEYKGMMSGEMLQEYIDTLKAE